MKKIFFVLVLTVLCVAVVANAAPGHDGKKKGKKGGRAPFIEQTVVLESTTDTVSYAIGAASTNGLIHYLVSSLKVDTLYLGDFIAGFYDAVDRGTDPKYVAYTAGQQIAQQVYNQVYPRELTQYVDCGGDTIDIDKFYQGFIAGVVSDTLIFTPDSASRYVTAQREMLIKRANDERNAINVAFLEENAKKDSVVVLPSGLQYKVLVEGDGKVATETSVVTCRYEGRLIDGTVFDSSYDRKPDTSKFRPDKVVKGWTEALQMMPEGSKWELYIPQELGYGERGSGQKIKPYSTLIFTLEVVKVE